LAIAPRGAGAEQSFAELKVAQHPEKTFLGWIARCQIRRTMPCAVGDVEFAPHRKVPHRAACMFSD
jgi:hypothetical protein